MNDSIIAGTLVSEPRLVRRRTRRLAAVAAAVLAVTLAAEAPVGPAVAAPPQPSTPKTDVPGVPRHDATHAVRPSWTAGGREIRDTPKVVWPAAGSATADLTTAAATARPAGRVRAGSLPVWAATQPGRAAAGRVQVSVRDRAASARAGVDGLVLDVSRADGIRAGAASQVTVDYSGFAQAYGGDWASRLRMVNLADGQALPSHNDTKAGTVTATVPLAAAGSTAVALAAGPSGENGTYAATSLSAAGTWQVSQHTGGFSWSQPIAMPPALNGPSPSLSLSYSSMSVDGRTAGTNTQGSWIGDGWDMWPGFIERQFTACAEDKDAVGGTTPNNTTVNGGDLCWLKPDGNATISLNGQATELAKSTGNTWKGVSDDGSKIELATDTSLGNGEYWKVTSTDGTQYFFGRNHGVGGATAATATNSTWTVPVYGNHPNEPGYAAGDFAASRRTQGWRWNLDYVVDTHGNTMTMYYTREGGAYGREGDPAKRTDYDRGGYLTRIEYGSRADAAATVQPAAQVVFGVNDRCAANCYTGTTPSPAAWLDTPWDQFCPAAPCSSQLAPTFWTGKRLSTIKTQVYSGTGTAYTDVEQWTLRHTYLDAGGNEGKPLWLAGITHSGRVALPDNNGPVTDPEIVFDAGQNPMANRVDDPNDNRSNLFRSRIMTVTTETGAQISPTYSEIQCTRSALPSPATNTSRCFPQWYGPAGEEPTVDWFHSYRVARVDTYDNTDGFTHEQTNYDYLDTPAWHYDDSELVPEKKRTWGQFRGYGKVRVRSGLETGTQSATEYLYFRGMDGDKQTSGVRDESVTDSQNVAIKDDDAFAGTLREETTLNGADGDWLTSAISTPGKRGPTATSGPLKAWMTNLAGTRTRTKLANGSTRWVKSVYTFNDDNLPTQVDDLGDESTTADDRCTRTWYARNATNWLLTKVKRAETVSVNCAATPTLPGDLMSGLRTTYDLANNNWDTFLPVKGDTAKVEQISSWTGTTPNWTLVSRATYDAAGRPLDVFDPLERKTHNDYTPALGGPVTQTAATNALGRKVTTTLNTAWGVPTKIVDEANALTTELSYDAAGRLLGIWLPGRSKASLPLYPNTSYAYQVRNNDPSYVTTKTLLPNGNTSYRTSITQFDGLLRERQTQTQATGGGRIIADTVYDSRGLVDWTSLPYYDTTNNPLNADKLAGGSGDPPPPATTVNIYDGAGRNTNAIFMVGTVEKWRTTTSYNGERVDVTPPDGGTATSSLVDARGQQVELRQYKSRADVGSTDPTKYDKTTYAYTKRGELQVMTDPAGNFWKYTYDQLGHQIRTEDPDKGDLRSAYDAAGQLTSTTDGRGNTLAYTYDDLGRKLTVRDGSATGAKRSEWIYDGLAGGIGQVTKAIRYNGGQQYVNEVSSFDAAGRVTGTKLTIPSTEGTLCAAGGATPCTFASTMTYRTNNQIASTTVPAAADLPTETLAQGYTDVGSPAGLVAGSQIYIRTATYNKLDELVQHQLGTSTSYLELNYGYENHTNRLISSTATPAGKPEIFRYDYKYDPAGNLLKIADTPNGGAADTQCYAYDQLRRLTEAWTPGGGDCDATRTTSALGGPAPYWHSYEYGGLAGLAGSRTRETWHATAGNTVRDYTYPAQGGAFGTKPHAVTSVATTGAATRTENYQYDAAGNTVCRPNGAVTNICPGTNSQTLTWDTENRLAADTAAGTSFVYDAAGNRLIRRDSTGTTLYLPDGSELRKTSTAVTGTRYYAGVAMRTAAGISWLAADQHGTAEATVNAATLAVSRRRSLPFGDERGTTSGAWPTLMDKGFVGGTKDATGLTHLGAREYDPGIGRFIKVDPVQDLADPQQWNGYAYANNNPGTFSDPDGLLVRDPELDNQFGAPKDGTGTKKNPIITSGGGGSGGHKEDPHRATIVDLPEKSMTYVCMGQMYCLDSYQITHPQAYVAEYNNQIARLNMGAGGKPLEAFQYAQAMVAACGSGGEMEANCATPTYRDLNELASTAMVQAKEQADGTPLWKSSVAALGASVEVVTGLPTCLLRGAGAGKRSFSGDTGVLLADRSEKQLKDIKAGDVVLATDPETGEEGPREVTQVWVHDDDLYTLTVNGTRLTTTEDHPYWDATDRQWERADELDKGDLLFTPDGTVARVDGFTYQTHEVAAAYNLTIDGIHTYYVLAGTTPVLVHNCGNRSHDKARGAAGVDEMTNTLEGIVGKGNVWSESHGNGFVFQTPYGKREVDVAVRTSDGGLRLFEVKTGKSNYTRDQRRKDEWLQKNYGFETTVVRRDTPCPICP